ncbi:MAG: SDR family oxidoreductase [Bacteroidota bacterium]
MRSEKTILLTGGTDGIGLATAKRLANKQTKLVLACRDREKGEATIDMLRERSGNENINLIDFDLSDLESVQNAAQEFLAEYPRLDVLINNAGTYSDQLYWTKQGYEWQFGVNYLGHYLLTRLLVPALCCGTDRGRVINVSSDAHRSAKIDFDKLHRSTADDYRYKGMRAYSTSKLANVLFTTELARRYPQELTANALHPGVVATRLANKGAKDTVKFIWNLYKPFALKPKRGANTSVYLALSPEVREVSGRYFDKSQCLRKPSPKARDQHLAAKLWKYSEEAVEKYLIN